MSWPSAIAASQRPAVTTLNGIEHVSISTNQNGTAYDLRIPTITDTDTTDDSFAANNRIPEWVGAAPKSNKIT